VEVSARWPQYPPYGGIHKELIAHLTVVEAEDDQALDRAAVVGVESMPFEVVIRDIHVIAEDEGGRWHRRWRLPLRPTAGSPRNECG